MRPTLSSLISCLLLHGFKITVGITLWVTLIRQWFFGDVNSPEASIINHTIKEKRRFKDLKVHIRHSWNRKDKPTPQGFFADDAGCHTPVSESSRCRHQRNQQPCCIYRGNFCTWRTSGLDCRYHQSLASRTVFIWRETMKPVGRVVLVLHKLGPGRHLVLHGY